MKEHYHGKDQVQTTNGGHYTYWSIHYSYTSTTLTSQKYPSRSLRYSNLLSVNFFYI
jgi:hypothetical protein